MNCKPCIYFVEGQCEKKLINALKANELIQPGRAEVFNVLTQKITKSKLTSIKQGTTIIMVFDTDVDYNLAILKENCDMLKKYVDKIQIHFLPQVKNLEEELVRSTDVKSVKEITKSQSDSDFKTDFINLSDCYSTLKNHNFDINKMWKQKLVGAFETLNYIK